jgi:flagellin-like hook-associated protein FlgL
MLYTDAAWGGGAGAVHVGEARFTNLGVRVSAAAYGSEEYLSINQTEGRCWQYYADPDSAAATVVDPEQGTRRVHGGDARINLNGERKRCRGLSLELATTEMTGALAFHAGKVGATTVAQVGYSDGSIFTNAAFLTNVSDGWVDSNGDGLRNSNETTTFKGGAHLVNAGTSMKETLGFQGGMQLQLGEGAGTQERTVMGLPSVAVATLGRTEAEDGAGRIALGDLIGGGAASLATDPIQALQVIDAAITEVAETRARIGAWQKNLLATNVNSLEVAVEKTTSTESYIRDANMAAESIDFTRNQIISRSSTAMLAQANVQARRVLRLLRR